MSGDGVGSLSEFLHMGGYAFYVWSSYALVLLVLALNVVLPILRGRAVRRELRRSILTPGPAALTARVEEPETMTAGDRQ